MPDVFTVFLNKDDDDDDEKAGAVFPLPIVPRVLSFSSLQHPPPPTPPPPQTSQLKVASAEERGLFREELRQIKFLEYNLLHAICNLRLRIVPCCHLMFL